jgi:hypothetical protein
VGLADGNVRFRPIADIERRRHPPPRWAKSGPLATAIPYCRAGRTRTASMHSVIIAVASVWPTRSASASAALRHANNRSGSKSFVMRAPMWQCAIAATGGSYTSRHLAPTRIV